MHRNLQHIFHPCPCKDADCELHNPEVGLAEGTVNQTELAFFLAGADTLLDLMNEAVKAGANFEQAAYSAYAELLDQHVPLEVPTS